MYKADWIVTACKRKILSVNLCCFNHDIHEAWKYTSGKQGEHWKEPCKVQMFKRSVNKESAPSERSLEFWLFRTEMHQKYCFFFLFYVREMIFFYILGHLSFWSLCRSYYICLCTVWCFICLYFLSGVAQVSTDWKFKMPRYLLFQDNVPIISVFLLQAAQNYSLTLLLLVWFFIWS